jgi:serine/threonine protein kinase
MQKLVPENTSKLLMNDDINYISPEFFGDWGLKEYDCRTLQKYDIYGLGVLFYKLITGKVPLDLTKYQSQLDEFRIWKFTSENNIKKTKDFDALKLIILKEIVNFYKKCDWSILGEFESIIKRMLKVDPYDRIGIKSILKDESIIKNELNNIIIKESYVDYKSRNYMSYIKIVKEIQKSDNLKSINSLSNSEFLNLENKVFKKPVKIPKQPKINEKVEKKIEFKRRGTKN